MKHSRPLIVQSHLAVPGNRQTWLRKYSLVFFFLRFSLSDSNVAPVSQRCACHTAGRPLPGEFLLTSGGETQQARSGSEVSLATA